MTADDVAGTIDGMAVDGMVDDDVVVDDAVLDHPVAASLRGQHAHLARQHGRAMSFAPTVSRFSAVPLDPSSQDWADLATLLGPGVLADLFSSEATPPEGWRPEFCFDGLQMVGAPDRFSAAGAADHADVACAADHADVAGAAGAAPDVLDLGEADVPEMLDLVAGPGPVRSGPTRTSSAGTSESANRAGWWPWPVSDCDRRAGPRSAPCALLRRHGVGDSLRGWSAT